MFKRWHYFAKLEKEIFGEHLYNMGNIYPSGLVLVSVNNEICNKVSQQTILWPLLIKLQNAT